MKIITADVETFFDNEYSWKRLTTEAYCRDKRFEVHGWGIRTDDGKGWATHEEAAYLFKGIDWSRHAVLAHHAQFDLFILNYVYSVRPALILDTLSMARQVLGTHVSASLDSLAKHYGLKAKTVPYDLFRGKRWAELTPHEQALVSEGCLHDCELTYSLFIEFMKTFPKEELGVIDMTVRLFTEPVLEADIQLLGKVWTDEEKRKSDLLLSLKVDEGDLQSSETFASLLRAEGVEPETKQGKNGPIFAFAKTDDFMKELLEDENPTLAALAAARLGIKSTIDQTRAERLGFMAQRGAIPVYLRYFGAHSSRWSGGDGTNFQNLRRGSDLRRALRAPEGYLLGVVDASQIEARLLDTLSGQWDKVEKWRNGDDQYSELATQFYGFPVSRETPEQRQFGKVLKLQAGYGAGADSIQAAAKRAKPPVVLDDVQALQARDLYRDTHKAVVARWGDAGRILSRLASENYPPLTWGPFTVHRKKVFLPNGGWVDFSTLEYHSRESEEDPFEDGWRYRTRQGWKRIWGSALVAITTQALARVVVSQAVLRMRSEGFRFAMTTHDDVVAVLPQAQAKQMHERMIREFSTSPTWLPECPLAAEGALEEFYAK